jgi:Arc/MetJ family transcription regulator
MVKRTTIEIDQELLERAKEALGQASTRATVEEALRQAADRADQARSNRAGRQQRYLQGLSKRSDAKVLGAGDMWR